MLNKRSKIMKLRNKKTGEIVCARFCGVTYADDDDHLLKMWLRDDDNEYEYNSLAELNYEWEDYEEPLKPYWFINDLNGEPMKCDLKNCGKSNFIEWGEHRKQIGNHFETREEAEKAVEKLKAWKRLRDKGFRFKGWNTAFCEIDFDVPDSFYPIDGNMITNETEKDLDLLFGGEE